MLLAALPRPPPLPLHPSTHSTHTTCVRSSAVRFLCHFGRWACDMSPCPDEKLDNDCYIYFFINFVPSVVLCTVWYDMYKRFVLYVWKKNVQYACANALYFCEQTSFVPFVRKHNTPSVNGKRLITAACCCIGGHCSDRLFTFDFFVETTCSSKQQLALQFPTLLGFSWTEYPNKYATHHNYTQIRSYDGIQFSAVNTCQASPDHPCVFCALVLKFVIFSTSEPTQLQVI